MTHWIWDAIFWAAIGFMICAGLLLWRMEAKYLDKTKENPKHWSK